MLLGVLTLGTGLGIGLGLSEAPRVPPVFRFGVYDSETCIPFSTPTKAGVTCSTTGSGISLRFTAAARPHIAKGQSSCLPQQVPISRGPNALKEAVQYLESQCFEAPTADSVPLTRRLGT